MFEGSAEIVGSDRRTCPKVMGDDIPASPCIYFLSADRKIKIGFSKNLRQRIQQLKCASMLDVSLLGWMTGDRPLEKAILIAASAHRIKGEWFHDRQEVRAIVAAALMSGGDAFADDIKRQTKNVNSDVAWAAAELRKIAGPRAPDDSIRNVIERAALKIGASYWRTFDLWYEKARRLEIREKKPS